MKIGYVTSISGAKISGILFNPTNKDIARQMALATQIGAMVKMRTPESVVFGMISSLKTQNPSNLPTKADVRMVEIDLLGESMDHNDKGKFTFQRGVSIYPRLSQLILSTTSSELAQIHARPNSSTIKIGTIRQDRSLPSYLSIDDLFGKHFAILGATSSGKSCTVAVILQSVLNAFPNGHVVLLDPHDEYACAFGDLANVITPERLQLTYWLLNFDEIVEVLCSPDTVNRKIEAAILKDAITAAKKEFPGNKELAETLTVDTPVPYRLNRIIKFIHAAEGQLNRPEKAQHYMRLVSRIEHLQRDQRFSFMFTGPTPRDNMAELMSDILRIPGNQRPITIFSLAGLPSDIVDVVVSVLCRMIFDFALWSSNSDRIPALLVCEEAQRYVPRNGADGVNLANKSIGRIAKEGRKYGISLGLVTQRPTEISDDILSQCSTLFAMRLSSKKDQNFIQAALPESATGLIDLLPALRTQEVVVVGEAVNLPTIVRIDDIVDSRCPQSYMYKISTSWQNNSHPESLVSRTVDRWRRQLLTSTDGLCVEIKQPLGVGEGSC